MSTILKGDTFENRVFEDFQKELEDDNLFVPAKKSMIFQKKAYYSKDRNSDIITDISIETFLPGASEYSILTVIECKDYSSNIPVDDIEEFHAKIQQISGNNIKAIFATTASLQKAALAYAKAKKIALVRYLPLNQVRWVFYNMTPDMFDTQLDPSEFNAAFLNPLHIGQNRELYACDDRHIYGNLESLLKNFLKAR